MERCALGIVVIGAILFPAGVLFGVLGGWKLCRGLALSQPVTTDEGKSAIRITLDPGAYPWSGAQTQFIEESE